MLSFSRYNRIISYRSQVESRVPGCICKHHWLTRALMQCFSINSFVFWYINTNSYYDERANSPVETRLGYFPPDHKLPYSILCRYRRTSLRCFSRLHPGSKVVRCLVCPQTLYERYERLVPTRLPTDYSYTYRNI